ncbi:MAG: PEP-CTERM sorting domain-containing protein [Acidobacteriota bacterium]|nr:PEP-CTERM sorting domain-containing protein [Acidobacteriota bacterium]
MADTITFSGSTAPPSPTFRRPVETGDAFAFDEMGNPVFARFSTFNFFVSISGQYDFLSTQNYDGFLLLYRTTFTPSNLSLLVDPNFFVAGDDDLIDFVPGQSGFSATLSTNVLYFLITTGFDDSSFGNFTNQITGPGQVIPEPATMILLATGLAGAAATRRRKRRQTGQS